VNRSSDGPVSADSEDLPVQVIKHLSWLSLSLLVASAPAIAYAEATVIVELKGEQGTPVNGTVELVKGDTHHRCITVQGRCEMRGVAGGMYEVKVSDSKKPAPKAKQVMIPPSGEVKLVVNAG
jgi:hypothetical protein